MAGRRSLTGAGGEASGDGRDVGQNRGGAVQVLDLTTDAAILEQDLPGGTVGAAVIEVQAVLTLPPGRYRATVAGQGPDGGVRDISFTVVA